ncbi:hypothetical protein [Niallia sp. 01092]|uniref:hypothetical protein n=1 Tax=unclassified Niallia TaxID=2837522 RepID=UPI003FCF958D
MVSRGKELLTKDQRAEFVRIPANITERSALLLSEEVCFFSLTACLIMESIAASALSVFSFCLVLYRNFISCKSC